MPTPPTDLQRAVLEHVRRPQYQPVKPKVIAKQLGLNQEGLRDLKRVIKKLIKRGELQWGANHLVMATRPENAARETSPSPAYTPPDSDNSVAPGKKKPHRAKSGEAPITGVFRRVASGHGYVRPDHTPRELGRTQDIRIPASAAGDASTGDRVLVRLRKGRSGKSRLEGVVTQVVERETNRFVGTYFEQDGVGLAQVDGKLFSQPIQVGDPGAKGAKPDDKVVIEMVRFPSHRHDGEGVIVEVLGGKSEPGVDTLSIIHEYGLPGPFPEDAMESAREQAAAFDESLGARKDFTGETIVTIDPVDARDFDDAISLKRTAKGHWLLGVHIADVSHFVPPKTALDREARDRATSVYLPDRVIPMLPEIISNNLASLQPDKIRYALTAEIEMTAEGVRIGCDMHKSAIKSKRRFTYEEVDDYLARRAAWKKKLEPDVHKLLGDMHELAMILRGRRFQRGSLELTMPEVKVDLDEHGRAVGAHLVENTESHQIIEEFMLAANEAVAEKLRDADYLFLRRIHEAPDPRKLQALTEFVRELGFETESLESRFEIQKLLDAAQGLPQQYSVNYATLRSMQKAIYSPLDEGHYALAAECYCHFTSPIRRYPDLTIHRLIEATLIGRRPHQELAQLVAEGEHCSDREQRATAAERDLTKLKLLHYFADRVGEEMAGVITGVEDFGLFIQGVEMPAEGFVHISALQDDYYHFDRATHSLTGFRSGNAYRLGEPVQVAIARVDLEKRELDMRLLGKLEGLLPAPPPKKKKRGKKKAEPTEPAAKKPAKRKKKAARKKGIQKKVPRKRG